MRRFDYFRPKSLEEAFRLKAAIPGAKFISGGTDLMIQLKNQELQPPALISLRSVSGLDSIDFNGSVRIGALATINDIIRHPKLGEAYPALVEAAKSLGSVQIRNVATIGGNLCNCSPSADMVPPLLVLGAKIRLQSSQTSRALPLLEFFLGPGESCLASDEVLTDIFLAPPHENTKATFLKMGRVKMDIAIASVAVMLQLEREMCCKARVAAGSVAPVPIRLFKVEKLLEGTVITRQIVSKAQKLAFESVSPITDIRATKEYRRLVIAVYVKRALEKILGWSS